MMRRACKAIIGVSPDLCQLVGCLDLMFANVSALEERVKGGLETTVASARLVRRCRRDGIHRSHHARD
jgi:hypothetical protein